MSRRLATSTLTLVGSQAIYNGGLAVEFALIVNWFGDTAQGSYSIALGLASLFEVGVHWGSQHLVNREAAARFDTLKARLPALFAASLLTIGCVAVAITGVYGWPMAVIATAALMRAGAMLVGAICIGRGHLLAPVIARILSPLLALGVMVFWVRHDPTLAGLALATVAATVGYAGPMWLAARHLGLHGPAGPSRWLAGWRQLAGDVWPYLVLFFFGQLLFRSDSVLLKVLSDETVVAHYMRAFKWIEGLFFLPHVVASVAIPALVAAGRSGDPRAQGRTLLQIALVLVCGLSLVAVALRLVGPAILHMVLGEAVADASTLFGTLVWIVPIHGLGIYLAAALVTRRQERTLLVVVIVASLSSLAAKAIGFSLFGTGAFVWGLYFGLLLHAVGCAWCLWRQPGSPA